MLFNNRNFLEKEHDNVVNDLWAVIKMPKLLDKPRTTTQQYLSRWMHAVTQLFYALETSMATGMASVQAAQQPSNNPENSEYTRWGTSTN